MVDAVRYNFGPFYKGTPSSRLPVPFLCHCHVNPGLVLVVVGTRCVADTEPPPGEVAA